MDTISFGARLDQGTVDERLETDPGNAVLARVLSEPEAAKARFGHFDQLFSEPSPQHAEALPSAVNQ